MARLPRLIAPHQPHHIVQSGNNRQLIFHEAGDYIAFLGWLREAARQFKVALHAYVLLPQSLHLLASPSDSTGLSRMMQWVGRHYVPYFNTRYQRSGTLWQGRFKATVMDPDQYLLLSSRFIELYPAREGLVTNPAEYPWSSCAHHVGTRSDPLITDHPRYWALGNTPFDRELAYRAMLEQGLPTDQVRLLEDAVEKGWPLGSEQFRAALAKQVKRRVNPARRGRPRRIGTGVDPLGSS
jgi:putative transposase